MGGTVIPHTPGYIKSSHPIVPKQPRSAPCGPASAQAAVSPFLYWLSSISNSPPLRNSSDSPPGTHTRPLPCTACHRIPITAPIVPCCSLYEALMLGRTMPMVHVSQTYITQNLGHSRAAMRRKWKELDQAARQPTRTIDGCVDYA